MKAQIYKKQLADGRKHLYIRYLVNGVQRVKMLDMYLTGDTEADAVTLKRAKSVTRQLEKEHAKQTISMILQDYADTMANKSTSTKTIICRLVTLWNEYDAKGNSTADNVNASTIANFARFLIGRKLSNNTVRIYLRWLNSALNNAQSNGILTAERFADLNKAINKQQPKAIQPERGFLTEAEKKQLFETPRPNETFCNAFEFSTLTGLRYSDIRGVKPADVKNGRLIVRMQKTQSFTSIKLTERAQTLLNDNYKAWGKMPACTALINYYISEWCTLAGVKAVTIHIARHTFATELINKGASIKAVQSLLGHKNINTTQIYAELIDETKDNAVMLLNK